MKKRKTDPRIAAAAAFARPGAAVADIGTDHAALPILLVGSGIAPYAVAADINSGPLSRARSNIDASGFGRRINTLLTDGLTGVGEYLEGDADVYILGMGGELIWKIIASSDLPRRHGIRLILQPMSHAYDLREGLLTGGYDINDESLVTSGGRVYQIICAAYDGVAREWSGAELTLGRHNISRGGKLLARAAEVAAHNARTRANGLTAAGAGQTDFAERQYTLAHELDLIAKATDLTENNETEDEE